MKKSYKIFSGFLLGIFLCFSFSSIFFAPDSYQNVLDDRAEIFISSFNGASPDQVLRIYSDANEVEVRPCSGIVLQELNFHHSVVARVELDSNKEFFFCKAPVQRLFLIHRTFLI
jgi:hypothetical protein